MRTTYLAVLLVCLVGPRLAGAEPLPVKGDIKLPEPKVTGGTPLLDALRTRQSQRSFRKNLLPPATLSALLWAANGVNRPESGKRTAPSAVNWQEIDVYVARADGLYLYEPKAHVLRHCLAGDIRASAGKQDFVKVAPVVLIYVADLSRMKGADEANQTFYSATDTGFISQNVYLYCAAEGLSTVVLGWVDKDKLAKVMGLRPDQRIVLTQPVGYPEAAEAPQPRSSAPSTAAYRDGTYRGTSRGYVGSVEVEVRVEDGDLSNVQVVKHRENRPRTAITEMPKRILKAGTTEGVDAVTGATITSRAILRAASEACELAKP